MALEPIEVAFISFFGAIGAEIAKSFLEWLKNKYKKINGKIK